jgi:sugar O-acyltransferase (sialic acid O-acetyltransferase NeuD family)
MKDKIYILGVGRNTPVYIDLAEICGYEVSGLVHYNNDRAGEDVHGYAIVCSTDDLLQRETLEGLNFALSMGDNKLRRSIAEAIRRKGGKTPSLINPKSYISKFVKIGDGVIVHANASVQADVIIGDDSVISFNADIAHNSRIDEGCFIAGGVILGSYTHMKRMSFIGVGVVIISGKVDVIGEQSFIGAGSVVTKSVDNFSILSGNPARVIGKTSDDEQCIGKIITDIQIQSI